MILSNDVKPVGGEAVLQVEVLVPLTPVPPDVGQTTVMVVAEDKAAAPTAKKERARNFFINCLRYFTALPR
jgi:hypothetical protein